MSVSEKPKVETKFAKEVVFCLPSEASAGNRKVSRTGQDQSAKFSIEDKRNVQLGGLGPAFRATSIKDGGKVRLGGLGPVFRA